MPLGQPPGLATGAVLNRKSPNFCCADSSPHWEPPNAAVGLEVRGFTTEVQRAQRFVVEGLEENPHSARESGVVDSPARGAGGARASVSGVAAGRGNRALPHTIATVGRESLQSAAESLDAPRSSTVLVENSSPATSTPTTIPEPSRTLNSTSPPCSGSPAHSPAFEFTPGEYYKWVRSWRLLIRNWYTHLRC